MISYDCRYWRGDRPCIWNKVEGSECQCAHHAPRPEASVLVIKLDALGDVLRMGSLLPAIMDENAGCRIAFLTRPGTAAEIARSMILVDEVVALTPEGMARITTVEWYRVYNLSNDVPSASIARMVAKFGVVGYVTDIFGQIRPTNEAAERWLELASFDRLKRENRRTWQSFMLDIIGSDEQPQRPEIRVWANKLAEIGKEMLVHLSGRRPRIGIYVGAGSRWPKKMLDERGCRALGDLIQTRTKEANVVFIAGRHEYATTTRLGGFWADSFERLVGLLSHVDVLIVGDTLALHAAIAIGLPSVALFGPTSASEIEGFGLVHKMTAPDLECLGCMGDCSKPVHCMNSLDLGKIAEMALSLLPRQPLRAAGAGPRAANKTPGMPDSWDRIQARHGQP